MRAAAAAVAAAADLEALPVMPPTSTTIPTTSTSTPFAGIFGGAKRPSRSLPAASDEDMDSVSAALEIPELVRSQFGRDGKREDEAKKEG